MVENSWSRGEPRVTYQHSPLSDSGTRETKAPAQSPRGRAGEGSHGGHRTGWGRGDGVEWEGQVDTLQGQGLAWRLDIALGLLISDQSLSSPPGVM
ncbi:hypothetical protein RRG08_037390 [Elysia crispata]|uniref:Uncharacterized protein n=1 Tax=Elysia crispata TaxID=231223 RepID=A0AAE1AG85_9GAST|nr:hypothetical protein RRG08_037390 [Elysia crispata]